MRLLLSGVQLWVGLAAVIAACNAPDHERVVQAATSQDIVIVALFGAAAIATAIRLFVDAVNEP